MLACLCVWWALDVLVVYCFVGVRWVFGVLLWCVAVCGVVLVRSCVGVLMCWCVVDVCGVLVRVGC